VDHRLRNVPVGVPVLLHGKSQTTYDWTMMPPGGSGATLENATTQNPELVPDVPGLYEIQVTDEATGSAVILEIYAGTWRGVIVGEDAEGRPVADAACTGCHSGSIAPDFFTPWAQTGHAEIFTDSLNTNNHYSSSCFSCHAVGYLPEVPNGGFDDAPDYAAFLASDLLPTLSDDNWSMMLADFPEAAQLGNIQCENCHGPQTSDAHTMAASRVSLSSTVCASCHGEPLRHGRYQQWQLSAHANYELAIEEGENGGCARCHTANGFLAWLPILLDDDPFTDPTADIELTWTADEVHPQTCQTCHDPHDIGTVSGNVSNATVRISGDTPPLIAGFQATDVGRGALCMTCHNTRRGLRNDQTYAQAVATGDQSRAPHAGTQADVVMGQNAYFVEVGNRGAHAMTENVADVCVTCHMESTPPPDALSYNQGGTNHTFFARPDICGDCHNFTDGAVVQEAVEAKIELLLESIEEAYLDLLVDKLQAGYDVSFGNDMTATSPSDVVAVELSESRGRQALVVTFSGSTVGGPYALPSIVLTPSGGMAAGLDVVASSNLLKAGWNYNLIHADESNGVHNPSFTHTVLDASIANVSAPPPACEPGPHTLCLNRDGRFKAEIVFDDGSGPRAGNAVSTGQRDSGLFWFFDEDNVEMLVKVLDACDLPGFNTYWVFYSATTDVEFTLTVTDTERDMPKVYRNQRGNLAPPVADVAAFRTCP
jgi:hypothetical protein